MNLQYSHAKEKFEDAIIILATGQKDIRHRLFNVYDCISNLQETEIPYELIEIFRDIKQNLQRFKIHRLSKDRVIIEQKLNIRNKTGEKIAQKIWTIYHKLHFEY